MNGIHGIKIIPYTSNIIRQIQNTSALQTKQHNTQHF